MEDKIKCEASDNINLTENIDLIRVTVAKTKYNLSSLFFYLLSFGIASLLFYILKLISVVFEDDIFELCVNLGFSICVAVLFFFFIKKRNLVKRTQNKYTLEIYDLWGFATLLPPFVNIMRVFFINDVKVVCYDVYIDIFSIAFVLVAIFITGVLTKKKSLLAFGSIAPFVCSLYLFLKMAFNEFKINTFLYHCSFLHRQAVIIAIAVTLFGLVFIIAYRLKGDFIKNEIFESLS